MNISTTEASFIALAKANGEFHDPIFDGVVDQRRYEKTSPKILWVLKEPWEKLKTGEQGGGWSVTRDLLRDGEFTDNKGTYPPMAYISYAVNKGFLNYEMVPYITNDPEVRDALKNLAYINIKKFPGSTSSFAGDLQTYYSRYEDFLLQQIEDISPEIVIFGGTYHYFRRALNIEDVCVQSNAPGFIRANKRLYIAAYHPNQRTIGKAAYVDGIVRVIKTNFSEQSKCSCL